MWSLLILCCILLHYVNAIPNPLPLRCGNYQQGTARLSDVRSCKNLIIRLVNPALTPGTDVRRPWKFLGPRGDHRLGSLPNSWPASDGCLVTLTAQPGQAGDYFALKEIFRPAMMLIDTCIQQRGYLGGFTKAGPRGGVTLEIDIITNGLLSTAPNSTLIAESPLSMSNDTIQIDANEIADATS